MNKMSGLSLDLEKENIDKLKELFPAAVEEGKINFDMLRALLGDEVDDSKEKYQFTWNGKSKAIKLAQTPSSTTLRPCKEKSKDWNKTENLYIEGDNLEVLKQLQKTYYGKIKMIYIDPPYNTGMDFVYKDSFGDSIKNYKEQTNQVSSSNPESNGRFHTEWLNMMYPRLILAKNLLKNDGVIFISIDDHELNNLVKIIDEIFGETNRLAILVWKKKYTGGKGTSTFADYHEYILAYSKNRECLGEISMARPESEKEKFIYSDEYEETRGKYYTRPLKSNLDPRPTLVYPIELPDGNVCTTQWICAKETFEKLKLEGRIEFKDSKTSKYPVYKKFYENDGNGEIKIPSFLEISNNNEAKEELKKLFGIKQTRDLPFQTPKPVELLSLFVKNFSHSGDTILDFFSGSGSLAHSIMKINVEEKSTRKFIMVQLDEKNNIRGNDFNNICDIGEERIRRAGEQLEVEWKKEHPLDTLFSCDEDFTTDIGFKVFKLDSSNVNEWDSSLELDEKELAERLGEVFKTDRSKEDILYEIMLKYGVFDRQVEEIDVNGKTMYRVGKRYMIVCLEDNIDSNDVKAIGELAPKTVIFKESGFIDDNAKLNAVYNLEKAGVEDIKCI